MMKDISFLLIISSLLLAFSTRTSDGCSYCVSNRTASDDLIQAKLDYACGTISCALVQPRAPCYVPNNLKATASFVFNDMFLGGSECEFEGAAVQTVVDPSRDNCKFNCQ